LEAQGSGLGMEIILIPIGIIGFLILLFIITHLRPLSFEEVRKLGTKRRKKEIGRYFSFDNRERSVNSEFKKRMKPTGKFYQINENLFQFPSTAAALLKYKKHEWCIIAFEKDKKVFLIWVNKGPDRTTVSSLISLKNIAKVANENDTTSVLAFHNHPNPDPNYVSCTQPSQQDLQTAKVRSSVLNQNNLNLLSFVCERGRHYKYFFSPSDAFLPLPAFIEAINAINGKSRSKNLSLHFERIFLMRARERELEANFVESRVSKRDEETQKRIGKRSNID
jgi:hypothetical protein